MRLLLFAVTVTAMRKPGRPASHHAEVCARLRMDHRPTYLSVRLPSTDDCLADQSVPLRSGIIASATGDLAEFPGSSWCW